MTTINLNFPEPAKVFNRQIYDSLFDYDHFIEVWYGGASSGKSHGVVQKVVLKALKKWPYPRKILWLRKVDRTIKDIQAANRRLILESTGLQPLLEDMARQRMQSQEEQHTQQMVNEEGHTLEDLMNFNPEDGDIDTEEDSSATDLNFSEEEE